MPTADTGTAETTGSQHAHSDATTHITYAYNFFVEVGQQQQGKCSLLFDLVCTTAAPQLWRPCDASASAWQTQRSTPSKWPLNLPLSTVAIYT
jgi:hypothetical protein